MPVPPSSKVQLREAAKLYEAFSGHDAEIIGELDKPKQRAKLSQIGVVSAIEYDTVRDSAKEYYRHDFEDHAGPALCASENGRQLHFFGGSYDFTERGIVDRPRGKRKNLTNRQIPDVLIAVGEINALECGYERLEFPKKSRPLLCSSFDGKQLYMLGGAYNFKA